MVQRCWLVQRVHRRRMPRMLRPQWMLDVLNRLQTVQRTVSVHLSCAYLPKFWKFVFKVPPLLPRMLRLVLIILPQILKLIAFFCSLKNVLFGASRYALFWSSSTFLLNLSFFNNLTCNLKFFNVFCNLNIPFAFSFYSIRENQILFLLVLCCLF